MAGYTNSFVSINGDLITAPLFDQEYSNLGDAFDLTGGHKHDGTATEGALIPLIASSFNEVLCDNVNDRVTFSTNVGAVKTLQLTVEDGALLPAVTNDVDLGSVALMYKDGYITNGLLTTLTLGATTQVNAVLNESDMISNSATSLVTQASLVTYTTTVVGGATIDGGAF